MPRNYQPVELNTFVGGLITEASPLTFPQNASLYEVNFVLNKNGSRSRRLGMDLEDNYTALHSPYDNPTDGSRLVVNSFKWDNAGGEASKSIIVVQVGGQLTFFDSDITPLSSGLIFSLDYSTNNNKRFSFASIDGRLVVTTGQKNISVFSYNTITKQITNTSERLLIRDLFGLEDVMANGTDLRVGNNISIRPLSTRGDPDSCPPQHIYNLRNQTWGITRPGFNGNDYPIDVITNFLANVTPPKYPSNADSIIPNLYPNTSTTAGSKTLVRFDAENAGANPPGNSYAPIGYFIIDALDRGTSRREELSKLPYKYPYTNAGLTSTEILNSIPVDSTPSGPTCVCEYAGRVWYAGFPGEVVGGDSSSPKMASYVLFSQLVNDPTDILACYQAADPTDKDNSDLVDTDGGFLRIQGAYNIVGMVNLGNTLLVFADNGVWSVSGGNSYGFTANNYKVAKLTSSGCISPGSIVTVENAVLYWSRDGIYNISQNQYGDYGASSMTAKTIQTYYNSIPESVSRYSEGVYDSFEKQVKWLYYNGFGLDHPPTELVMDVSLGAFYRHEIQPNQDSSWGAETVGYPLVVKGIQTNPFSYSYNDESVVVNSDIVSVGIDDVLVNTRTEIAGTKEVIYLILLGVTGEYPMGYSFGSYKNVFHFDWSTLYSEQIDAESKLITGYLSGGDYQRDKQIIYLTVHCLRTETGSGTLTNKSSCLTQTQWDWSNSSDSGRWTREFQAYRLFGPYYPSIGSAKPNYPLTMDVVETRNKVRGTGKVISVMFKSEPGMHLTLLGWSINLGVEGNV